MNSDTEKREKVIKRYSNRKMYDTVDSRYVTLEDIGEMVKQGLDVKIIDNRTKEDLTSVTLAQIVFEEEKRKTRMPLAVWRDIIRRPSESLTEFVKTELTPRVLSIREGAEHRIDKLLRRDEHADVAPLLSGAELMKNSQRIVEQWQQRIDERVRHVLEGVVGNLPALGKDLQSLTEKIESLEKAIADLEAKRKADPP